MRLYSRAGAHTVDAPEGHFESDPDGGFSFPAPLHGRLHAAHVDGRRQWEDEIERQQRLHTEDVARRQDPATLYAAVADILGATRQLAGHGAPVDVTAELERLRAENAALRDQAGAVKPATAARKAPAKTGDGN